MTGLWMLTAVACAAEAIWLKQWRPVRAPSDLAPAERMRELPLPLILGIAFSRPLAPFHVR